MAPKCCFLLEKTSRVAIELPLNRAVVLGRGEYGIGKSEKTISRRHAEFILRTAPTHHPVEVEVTPLGINPVYVLPASAAADEIDLPKAAAYVASVGDTIRFSSGAGDAASADLRYSINWAEPPHGMMRPNTDSAAPAAATAAASKPLPAATTTATASSSHPRKRLRTDDNGAATGAASSGAATGVKLAVHHHRTSHAAPASPPLDAAQSPPAPRRGLRSPVLSPARGGASAAAPADDNQSIIPDSLLPAAASTAASTSSTAAGHNPKRVRPRVSPLPKSPPRVSGAAAAAPASVSAAFFSGSSSSLLTKPRRTHPVTGEDMDSAEWEALRDEKEREAEEIDKRRNRALLAGAGGAGAGAGAAGAGGAGATDWSLDAYPDRVRANLKVDPAATGAAAATAASGAKGGALAMRARLEREAAAAKAAGGGGARSRSPGLSGALTPPPPPAVVEKDGDDTNVADGRYALAFPSISTGYFDFSIERALPIALRCIDHFLVAHKDPRLRLIYINDTEHLAFVEAFEKYHAQCDRRLIVHNGILPSATAAGASAASAAASSSSSRAAGGKDEKSGGREKHIPADITKLKSQGCPARYILNPTNFRFSAGGGCAINLAVSNAVGGSQLQNWSVAAANGTAKVGVPYMVHLPMEHPLRVNERIHSIIQIRGPNMDVKRPDPVLDYTEACTQLKASYDNSFGMFFASLKLPPPTSSHVTSKALAVHAAQINDILGEFASDHKSAPSSSAAAAAAAGGGGGTAASPARGTGAAFPTYKTPPADGTAPAPGGRSNWSNALIDYLSPTRSSSLNKNVFWEDDNFIAIYDKFPKARIHLLLMPRQRIDNVNSLRPKHVSLLTQLIERGQWLARGLKPISSSHPIKLGFHAAPSMRQLHLHVISTDFDSPSLRVKKHWISFTHPEFFLDPTAVLKRLESGTCPDGLGLIIAQKEELLKGALHCHRCRAVLRTMPALTAHISVCNTHTYG